MDKLIDHIVSKYLFKFEVIKKSTIHFLHNNKSFVVGYSNYCGYYYGCFLSYSKNDYTIYDINYTVFDDAYKNHIRYIIDENFTDFTYFDMSINSILKKYEKLILNNDMLIVSKLLNLNTQEPDIKFLKTERYNISIKQEFEKRGLNFEEINNLLIKYECIISGSFLIQILNNEIYEESDIDIFCIDDKPIKEYFLNMGGKLLENTINDYLEYTSSKLNINNTIINIISFCNPFTFEDEDDNEDEDYTMSNSLQSYLTVIKRKFDFTFCMNVYNGNSLYYNESTLYKTSECYNNTSEIGEYLITKLNRCKKYINRGFLIEGINDENSDYLLK